MSTYLNKRIRTFLYQDQLFSRAELDLLHTPSLQRLYDLRQLGLADRVFIDATHTRLSHVLGAMEMATRIYASIKRSLERSQKEEDIPLWAQASAASKTPDRNSLSGQFENRLPEIRLIAFLHDLTHAPFGHTLEDEIELVAISHDNPARQSNAFLRLFLEYLAWTLVENASDSFRTEWLARTRIDRFLVSTAPITDIDENVIIQLVTNLLDGGIQHLSQTRLSSDDFTNLLISFNFATRALYYLEVSHKFDPLPDLDQIPSVEYSVNRIIEQSLLGAKSNILAQSWRNSGLNGVNPMRFSPTRDAYCLDIIGNTICADLLDYAKRDSASSGLQLDFDATRIIEHFTIIPHKHIDSTSNHPCSGWCLRAAVDFSDGKFRGDVIGELIELLQVRYYVYERMLFHPTKCVAGAMLGRAIQLLGFNEIPESWQRTGDAVFLHQLEEVATLANRVLSEYRPAEQGNMAYSEKLFEDLTRTLRQFDSTTGRNVIELFRQRIRTIGDLIDNYSGNVPTAIWLERLLHSETLISHGRLIACQHIAAALTEINLDRSTRLTGDIIQRISSLVIARIEGSSKELQMGWLNDIKSTISDLLPKVQTIREEIAASSMLIARLKARRYAKRIFCLLPSNILANDIVLDRKLIAKRFLNPKVRAAAERTIERLANLPVGSVVIHCPPPEGPRKIARVLVTYLPPRSRGRVSNQPSSCTPRERPARVTNELRDIGKLGGNAGKLFEAHQEHVNSLEKMYVSMWRLWVAVTPPKDIEHRRLATQISKALGSYVFEGGGGAAIDNDAFFVEELDTNYGTGSGSHEALPVIAPVISEVSPTGADRTIGKSELCALLEPYIATFTRKAQKKLRQTLDETKCIDRMLARATDPKISDFLRAAKISERLAAPLWDARDIRAFINELELLSNGARISHFWESDVSYRLLRKEERDAIDRIREWIIREIALGGFVTQDGAVRIAEVFRRREIPVLFQPLLTSGLCASTGDTHTVFINSGDHDPIRLRRIFDDGERNELLPAEIRFTLAHELTHYFLSNSRDPLISESRDDERIQDIAERACQEIAGHVLVPPKSLETLLYNKTLTCDYIREICTKLGVHPRPFIVQLKEANAFMSLPSGYAVVWAKTAGLGLRVVQIAANRAISGPIRTLRDLDFNAELPFEDLCNEGISPADDTREIIASNSDPDRRSKVRLTMQKSGYRNPDSLRLVVIQRLT